MVKRFTLYNSFTLQSCKNDSEKKLLKAIHLLIYLEIGPMLIVLETYWPLERIKSIYTTDKLELQMSVFGAL